jgi:hypothetical protein
LTPAAGPRPAGPAIAFWLIGAPALLLAGSLGSDGFSPTNMYLRGLFGAAAFSAAVVPVLILGRLVPGAWPGRLARGWGLLLGVAAAVWQGGNWGDWPLRLDGLAWLLLLSAGAWLAVALQDRDRATRGSMIVAGSTAATGAALWVAANFLASG